ncbi:uncharacterized protein [Aquarana catesbeiana]|uniref:uncharacterized protein n=1 Tax=Aquarana catesbeiana TaxID=8400 RepID=UPI003CC96940
MVVNHALSAKHEVTVVCSLFEFYPEDISVEFETTCGKVLKPVKNSTFVKNVDGSVNATYEFWMNITSCSNHPSVTCEANHVTGVVKHTTGLATYTWQNNPTPTSTDPAVQDVQLMLYTVGGVLLSLLLFFFFYRTGKKYCPSKRVCFSLRQEEINHLGASAESVPSKRKEDDSSDVVYTMPIFNKRKTRQIKVNECETEYIVLRRL